MTNDGTKHTTKGKIGDNLLDVVVNNSVDLDGFGESRVRISLVENVLKNIFDVGSVSVEII